MGDLPFRNEWKKEIYWMLQKVTRDIKYVVDYPVYPEICLFSQTNHDLVFVCREMSGHRRHEMKGGTLFALARTLNLLIPKRQI